MSESVRAADFKIVRLQVRGELYTPIVGPSGTYLSPSELAMLTQVSGLEPTPLRRVEFVLCDESTPRHGGSPLTLARFRTREPLFLELGDSGLAIGQVERVWLEAAGTILDTVGRTVVAVASLDDSVLADIAWQGIQDQVLTGVCAVCLGEPDDNVFASVRLGALEESGLAGARVLRAWEG